jgi:transcriptional regulator with XRE-family HTH domain
MEMTALVPTRFRLKEELEKYNKKRSEADRLSQRELAARAAVSPTTINRMFSNLTAQVSLATLDAIADVLGIDPGELLERKRR